jgi:ABC-type nitrate/sulfonate/bicarbonate transport system permease component
MLAVAPTSSSVTHAFGLGALKVIGAVIVVGLIWQSLILWLHIPHYIVPQPVTVLAGFREHADILLRRTLMTITSSAIGLVISTTFACLIGIAFTLNKNIAQASLPLVIVFRSAPIAAVAPIIMLFLGRGIATSVAVVIIVSFFPLLVNLMRGLCAADANASELLHVYGASRWQQIRYVRIPYAMPYLFTGLRVAGASSILGAMLSEWITGSRGLGNLILESGEMRETALLWCAVLTAVAISLMVFGATSAGEQRFLHWRR